MNGQMHSSSSLYKDQPFGYLFIAALYAPTYYVKFIQYFANETDIPKTAKSKFSPKTKKNVSHHTAVPTPDP